jgi:hypothetical protein
MNKLRVYYMTKLEHAKKIIHDGRIKICMFDEANDPFELRTQKINGPADGIGVWPSTSTELGVICFGAEYKNPVMWAHYADNHRGVCLGFDTDERFLFPVEYDNRGRGTYDELSPGMTLDTWPDNTHRMWVRWKNILGNEFCETALKLKKAEWESQAYCLRKAGAWEHEKEIRMPVYLGQENVEESCGIFYKNLLPNMILREVVIGVRCPESIDQLTRYLKHVKHKAFDDENSHELSVAKAKADVNSFEIVISEKYSFLINYVVTMK